MMLRLGKRGPILWALALKPQLPLLTLNSVLMVPKVVLFTDEGSSNNSAKFKMFAVESKNPNFPLFHLNDCCCGH